MYENTEITVPPGGLVGDVYLTLEFMDWIHTFTDTVLDSSGLLTVNNENSIYKITTFLEPTVTKRGTLSQHKIRVQKEYIDINGFQRQATLEFPDPTEKFENWNHCLNDDEVRQTYGIDTGDIETLDAIKYSFESLRKIAEQARARFN